MNSSTQLRRFGLWIAAAAVVLLLFVGARFFSSERKAEIGPASNPTNAATADTSVILEFSGVTLAEAASRFSKASGVEITVVPEIANFRIGGRIKVGDVDTFLQELSQTLPVRVDAEGEKRFRIRSK